MLNPLYIFGDVVTIVPSGDSPTQEPQYCYETIDMRLKSFDPEIDFLVWAGGDVLTAIMVGMVLVSRDIWHFQWLRYERKRLPSGERTDEGATYIPTLIDLTVPE